MLPVCIRVTHAEAYIKADKNKAAEAELAVVFLRAEEAEAYGNMKRWSNAFESTERGNQRLEIQNQD
jgi:hypothetical protein